MRSKEVLSIAAFVIAFVFSAAFAMLLIPETRYEIVSVPAVYESHSVKSTNCFTYKKKAKVANNISALIQQDELNGKKRQRFDASTNSFSSFEDYTDSVEQYFNASNDIRTSNLPNDFETAWREHMKAWRDYSEFLNRMKKSAIKESFSTEEFEDTDAFYNREISRTWYEVLRIGKNHGADVTN